MKKPIIVIKVGTSTLTNGGTKISRGKLEELAIQFDQLKTEYNIVLVSSGAIAAAKQFLNIDEWESQVSSKQAMAAIGQPKLMQFYYEVFSDYNLPIAQCLLTYRDFTGDITKVNTLSTINTLLHQGYIPIINENDTVAVEEIELGDNDKLSAKLATLIGASKLILVSDIDGVYDKNPHLHADAKLITKVTDISVLQQYVDDSPSSQGTGGMTSKLQAAQICMDEGIETIITNGSVKNFIVDSLDDKVACTKFRPTKQV